MNHFKPSFERRLASLVALGWILLAYCYGDLVQGLRLAIFTMLSCELIHLVWRRPGFAVEAVPAPLRSSEYWLDDALHPALMAGYWVVGAGFIGYGHTDLGYLLAAMAVVFVFGQMLTFAVRATYGFEEVSAHVQT